VIAVRMRIDHDPQRLGGKALRDREQSVRDLRTTSVDEDDAIFASRCRYVALEALEHADALGFIIDELTDLVEAAVLQEFERIAERGGVLGAMETGYQRSRIQEESMYYEQLKHDGRLPLIGVNTFRNLKTEEEPTTVPLARSSEEEKQSQIKRLCDFQQRDPGAGQALLEELGQTAIGNRNIFTVLMQAVRHCSLGQITDALFEVGGQYRRNM
jgi:methylmalonyl-CoA mutase